MIKMYHGKMSFTAVIMSLMSIFAMFMLLGCVETDENDAKIKTSALTSTINEAKSERSDTLTSEIDGDDVPVEAYWVTGSQMISFDEAIASAEAVLKSAKSQKNVDNAKKALESAIAQFKDQKKPGKMSLANKSITVTGLQEYINSEISVGLFASADNISIDKTPEINGFGIIENETITIQLVTSASETPWTGIGSWYAFIAIQSEESYGKFFISKNAINFTTNPEPIVPFSEFRKFAFQSTWGDFVESMGFEFPDQSTTLDNLFQLIAFGFSYDQVITVLGVTIYKDQAMTQMFSGTDTVNADTVFYSEFPFWYNFRGEKIGEITGTITLTDITNPPQRVSIYARDNNYNWNLSESRISLSDVTGSTATVSWSIPIYEDDDFIPGSRAYFGLSVTPQGFQNSIDISIPGNKLISGFNTNVGSLGSVSIKHITISGTINVTLDGNPVPYVMITANSESGDIYSYTDLSYPGANAQWSIATRPLSSPAKLYFIVNGFDSENILFSREYEPNPDVFVHNTSVSGINIDLGNITDPNTPDNITPLVQNTWTDGSLGKYEIGWYSINVTPGTYYLWWNDKYSGNYTKTLDIEVFTFSGSPGNLTSISLSNYSGWDPNDNAWSSPSYFTANFTGDVYIRVRAYGGYDDTGTYAIAYNTTGIRPATNSGEKTAIITGLSRYPYGGLIQVGLFTSEEDIDVLSDSPIAGIADFSGNIAIVDLIDLYADPVRPWTGSGNYYAALYIYDYAESKYEILISDNTIDFSSSQIIDISTLTEFTLTPPSSAIALTPDTWISGAITETNKRIWYSFDITEGVEYHIYINDSDWDFSKVDAFIDACYSDRKTIFLAHDIIDGQKDGSFTAQTSGTVYVRVSSFAFYPGDFDIAYNTSGIRPAL